MRFPVRAFVLLAILALAVRLGIYTLFRSSFAFEQTGIVQGFIDYDLIAKNLISTGEFTVQPGLPYASVAPAFPFTLGALYTVFGRGSLQVVLLNSALVIATIALLLTIATAVMPRGNAVGVLAAACLALYPYMVFQDLTIIDTAMFMAVLTAFIAVMVALERHAQWDRVMWRWIGVGGVILGLLVLTRPLGFGAGIAVFLWFWTRRGLKHAFLRLVPVAIIGVVVVIPWNVRNYSVFGTFVNIGTHSGMNFWFGNSEYTIPFYKAGFHTQWATPPQPSAPLSAPAADRYMMALGLTFLRENLTTIPELTWVKFAAYWSVNVFPSKNPVTGEVPIETYTGTPNTTIDSGGGIAVTGIPATDPLAVYSESFFDVVGRTVHVLYFGSLLLLGIIGAVMSRRQWRDVSLLVYVQLVMTVLYVIFSGPTTRYRVPTDPLLFLFSAVTLLALWERAAVLLPTKFLPKR